MARKEISYPDDLLMNWVDLLRPIGFNDIAFRHDDEHLFAQRWQLQNSAAYQVLGDRAQTFPLRYKVSSSSGLTELGGIMTNRAGHSQLVGDIAELLGRKVGAPISRRVRKTLDSPYGEIRTHHFMSILRIASLGHDMGSPPFAHPGEYAVREWSSEPWRKNMFRGRLTKAALLDLENFDANANALNSLINQQIFTFPIMAAIAKYPNGSGDNPQNCYKPPKYGYLEKDRGNFEIIAETLGMTKSDGRGGWYYARHPLVYLLEAADDIAYLIHDFRDALKAGFYSLDTDLKPEALDFSPTEIETCHNIEQIFCYITGKYYDDYTLNGRGRKQTNQIVMRLAKMEAEVIDICTDVLAKAFLEHEVAILNGNRLPSLIDLCQLPSGHEFGPIYAAIRRNFKTTVIDKLDGTREDSKNMIKNILDAFCMCYFAVSDLESYGTIAKHQATKNSLGTVKTFLELVKGHDSQGEARFTFDSSFDDFIQDVLHWLCQQGDNDIVRLNRELNKIEQLPSTVANFKAKFSGTVSHLQGTQIMVNRPTPSVGMLDFP